MTVNRIALCAVLFSVLACVILSGPAGAAKQPIVIGAIFSVTGDNAPLGVPERDTVKMLEKAINRAGGINGAPVKVEYYDDGGKPEQAVQACQALLAKKSVVAIIGPTLTGPTLAIANMCQAARMPLIACAASVKIVKPVKSYVFKTAQTDSQAVEKLVDYLKSKKIKKIGFISDSNAFGASGRDQWMLLSKPARIETVAMEQFSSGDTDMTSQLTKIRSANPQAIVCWGTNPAPAILAKDARRIGIKLPLLMSHGVSNMEFIKLAGPAAEGVVFPSGKIIVAKAIAAADPQKKVLLGYALQYAKAYNAPASHFGGHAWDAFMLVTDAIRQVGPNRDKIRANIESRKKFVGIDGIFNFSPTEHNGLTKDAFALVQIKGGKWTLAK